MYIPWSGYFSSKYFIIKKKFILYFLYFIYFLYITIKERKAFEYRKWYNENTENDTFIHYNNNE